MTDRARFLGLFIAWAIGLLSVVLCAAIATRWLLLRFAVSSPWLEHAILWSLSAAAAIGGFLLFAGASWAWVYWRRGWRVTRISENRYAYE
jgi:hypothetical protein